MRKSPKRREAKRQEIIENLEGVSGHMQLNVTVEACIKTLAEALIFILEGQCPKKQ